MNVISLVSLILSLQGTPGENRKVVAARGYEKVFEMKVSEFDEWVVKEEKFLLNNVVLREVAEGRRGQSAIKFGASIRNKAKSYENFSIMLVGMDDKKVPLWVSKAVTSCDGNWVTVVQDYETSVQKGTLKATAIVWVKLTVSDLSEDD